MAERFNGRVIHGASWGRHALMGGSTDPVAGTPAAIKDSKTASSAVFPPKSLASPAYVPQPVSFIGVLLDQNARVICEPMSWKVSADSARAAKAKGHCVKEAKPTRPTSSMRTESSRNARKSKRSARTDMHGTVLQ